MGWVWRSSNHSVIPWMPQKPEESNGSGPEETHTANPNIIIPEISLGQNWALLWECCSWPSAAAPAGRFGCWNFPSAWWGCPGVSGHPRRAGRSRAPWQPAPLPGWSVSAPRWPAPAGKRGLDPKKEGKATTPNSGQSGKEQTQHSRQAIPKSETPVIDTGNLEDGISYSPGQLSGKTGRAEGMNFPCFISALERCSRESQRILFGSIYY